MTTKSQQQFSTHSQVRFCAAITKVCGVFLVLCLTAFAIQATELQPPESANKSTTPKAIGAAARGAAQTHLRDFLINTANGKDATLTESFNAFYKERQLHLFQTIEESLATKTKTELQQLSAVRKVEVQLQSALGGRKANIGIDLVGAFTEANTRAFGWQLRAYGAQENSTGINAGIFHRHISDNLLIGGNIFADYESHKHGNFLRYSFGAEVAYATFNIAANYYKPVTDERPTGNSQISAFSREGYDAQLRINTPDLHSAFNNTRMALDFYHFDGTGTTPADDGFRFGMESQLSPALRFGLHYDQGASQLGAQVNYEWTIGESRGYQAESNPFAPDLFAPAKREYSHRIALATVARDGASFGTLLYVPNTVTIADLSAVAMSLWGIGENANQWRFDLTPETRGNVTVRLGTQNTVSTGFFVEDGDLIFVRGVDSQTATAAVITDSLDGVPSSPLNYILTVVTPIQGRVDYIARNYVAGRTGAAQTLTAGLMAASGGIPPYTYVFTQPAGQVADFQRLGSSRTLIINVPASGGVSATSPPTSRTISAQLVINDASPLTPGQTISVESFLVAPLSISTEIRMGTFPSGATQTRPFVFHVFGGRFDGRTAYNIQAITPGGVNVIRHDEGPNPAWSLRANSAGNYVFRIILDDDNNRGDDPADQTPPIAAAVTLTVT